LRQAYLNQPYTVLMMAGQTVATPKMPSRNVIAEMKKDPMTIELHLPVYTLFMNQV